MGPTDGSPLIGEWQIEEHFLLWGSVLTRDEMSLPESIASKTKAPPAINDLRRLLVPFCKKYQIAKLEVFGSVADGTAKAGSDVDLMVTFKVGSEGSLFDFLDLKLELEDLLGCPVDLLTRESVTQMENWILRRSILECVRTIYAT